MHDAHACIHNAYIAISVPSHLHLQNLLPFNRVVSKPSRTGYTCGRSEGNALLLTYGFTEN